MSAPALGPMFVSFGNVFKFTNIPSSMGFQAAYLPLAVCARKNGSYSPHPRSGVLVFLVHNIYNIDTFLVDLVILTV